MSTVRSSYRCLKLCVGTFEQLALILAARSSNIRGYVELAGEVVASWQSRSAIFIVGKFTVTLRYILCTDDFILEYGL
jgi:hypothetical protein